MSISMWSYPWDLEDCGMAYALDDMKAHGIDGVSMITSYHAGRFLCIRSPKRKIYFPEDGVAYYPCDMKKFEHQRIQPRQAQFSREHPDFWPKLFEETEKRGMTVSGTRSITTSARRTRMCGRICVRCWTICARRCRWTRLNWNP